jgi:hypothetical protein
MANISQLKILEGSTRHVQIPPNFLVRTTPQSIPEDAIQIIQTINLIAEAWINHNGMKGQDGILDLCWHLLGRQEEDPSIV